MADQQGGLAWQALEWSDGTRYEGLTKDGVMHSHGVLTFPNKDRYEGQFENGQMHGAGAYVWHNGTVYRGDWSHGHMHGCGTAIWKSQQQQPGSSSGGGEVCAAEGKFFGSEFVGDVMPCSREEGYDSAVEADMAAYQARSFLQWRSMNNKQSSLGQQRQQQLAARGQRTPLSSSSDAARADARGLQLDEQQKLQGLVQRLALQGKRVGA